MIFPKLPEKKSIGTTDPLFVQQRQTELERYLKDLARHEVLSKDHVLRAFLGDEDKEKFQSLKDKKPLGAIASLTELDWHKMKEVYDYALATVKTKFRKEDFSFVNN